MTNHAAVAAAPSLSRSAFGRERVLNDDRQRRSNSSPKTFRSFRRRTRSSFGLLFCVPRMSKFHARRHRETQTFSDNKAICLSLSFSFNRRKWEKGEPPLNGPIDMNRLLRSLAPPLPHRVPLVALGSSSPLPMPSNPNHLEDIMALSAWKTRTPLAWDVISNDDCK